MDYQDCLAYCHAAWSEGGFAVEGLKQVIRVPNLSPDYDEEYHTNGLIQQACTTTKAWIESLGLKGLKTTLYAEQNKEPLLYIEIEGTSPELGSVLAYGHLDKMPHLDPEGWSEGLSATNPVIRGDKIYGRGTNDDCYASFLLMTSMKYIQEKGLPHPRVVMVLEAGEESGSSEIENYLEQLRDQIGDVTSIMVLDAECADYNDVWCCTSLRGVCIGTLEVSHVRVPVHSGTGTGIVPSTFRIARMLLSRIEDEQTGRILIPECHVEIPESRVESCRRIADQLGEHCLSAIELLPGSRHIHKEVYMNVLAKAWEPGLAVTGCDGIPKIKDGSNVIRANTSLKLSLRIPPGVDGAVILQKMKEILEKDPPYGAKVVFHANDYGNGWFGRDFSPKVNTALVNATKAVFGIEPLYYGEGGSIPLCNFFQKKWPDADIIVTGCAGVDSNPHGYDESLDIAYTGKFAAVLCGFLTSLQ